MSPRLTCALLVASIPCLVQAEAQAQGGSPEAEELFKQGRAALEAKDYSTACPKFSASLQIERAVGTLISLAQCEEATVRLAAARQHWQEAADLADATNDRLNRGPFARQHFAQVDPRVPRLLLRLAAGAPADTSVRRDDVTLGAAAFGVPLPLDPGAHRITVIASGRVDRSFDVSLGEGEQKSLDVEPGPLTPVASAPSPATPPPPPVHAVPDTVASGRATQRTVAYLVGGAGIVGLGLGSYFGLQAFSKWSAATSDCGSACAPGSKGQNEHDQAQTDATVSTVAFVAGGVAVAAGVLLFFTAPAPPGDSAHRLQVAPMAERSGGGILVLGRW